MDPFISNYSDSDSVSDVADEPEDLEGFGSAERDTIQLGDRLSDHLRNENRHAEAMNQLLEREKHLLERYLNQNR